MLKKCRPLIFSPSITRKAIVGKQWRKFLIEQRSGGKESLMVTSSTRYRLIFWKISNYMTPSTVRRITYRSSRFIIRFIKECVFIMVSSSCYNELSPYTFPGFTTWHYYMHVTRYLVQHLVNAMDTITNVNSKIKGESTREREREREREWKKNSLQIL